jgi:hypothetical protein
MWNYDSSTDPRKQMSLALVAALTGVCFAGAIAAVTIGLRR